MTSVLISINALLTNGQMSVFLLGIGAGIAFSVASVVAIWPQKQQKKQSVHSEWSRFHVGSDAAKIRDFVQRIGAFFWPDSLHTAPERLKIWEICKVVWMRSPLQWEGTAGCDRHSAEPHE
ncbi:MAG: hypothetical protein AAFX78_01035 [Cyanobacteria bacterium J06638_20]